MGSHFRRKEWQARVGRDLELVDRAELLDWLKEYPLPCGEEFLTPWDEHRWREIPAGFSGKHSHWKRVGRIVDGLSAIRKFGCPECIGMLSPLVLFSNTLATLLVEANAEAVATDRGPAPV